jgi:ribulose kinase
LILTAGQPVGKGLSAKAAQELGLKEGTAVGSAVIDAYAFFLFPLALSSLKALTLTYSSIPLEITATQDG